MKTTNYAKKEHARNKRLTIPQFERKYGVGFTRKHSGKMTDVVSISTSCRCNPNCEARKGLKGSICEKCYADAMHDQYSDLAAKLERNTKVLTTVIFPVEDIPYITSKSGYFRFEAFGDLVNEIQVVNYFNIAAANDHLKCALWTKNPWIIKSAIAKYNLVKPANLTIIGSSYFVNEPMDFSGYDFIDKTFTVYSPDYIQEHGIEINCGARSCATCGLCYENKGGREVSEMLKNRG